VIRTITRPSTDSRMASVLSISQDSANPFLNREVEPTIRTEAVKN